MKPHKNHTVMFQYDWFGTWNAFDIKTQSVGKKTHPYDSLEIKRNNKPICIAQCTI